ncbi:MAG: hypothetical protein JRN68_03245 [Nitrososphaerota archaeon]|nr:hypothetical protein [Nitrososphaerota archaeon]
MTKTLQNLCIDLMWTEGGAFQRDLVDQSFKKYFPLRDGYRWPSTTDIAEAFLVLKAESLVTYSQGNYYLTYGGRDRAKHNNHTIAKLVSYPTTRAARIRMTGRVVHVRNLGSNFVPKWWSKSNGYFERELDFGLPPRHVNDPTCLLTLIGGEAHQRLLSTKTGELK